MASISYLKSEYFKSADHMYEPILNPHKKRVYHYKVFPLIFEIHAHDNEMASKRSFPISNLVQTFIHGLAKLPIGKSVLPERNLRLPR